MSTSLDGFIADPREALRRESRMLACAGPEGACGVWATSRCVVVPRSVARHPAYDAARAAMARRGLPVVLRGTGGGIVPQGPGILNVSVVVPIAARRQSVRSDFRWLCEPLRGWLAERGIASRLGRVPGSFCDGEYNVVVADRKLAGTAQRRSRTHALLHMVVLAEPKLGDALDAVRTLRCHLGDATPLFREAHVAMASFESQCAGEEIAQAELRRRFQRHLEHRLRAPFREERTMENETIHIHLIVDVPAETAAGFEALMNELVAVASKEEGTLVYEWYATGDGRTWHILERYADAERGDAHVRGFAENFAARFFELVSSCKAIVSNNATPYIRGVLEGLAPTYITQCAGLHRF